MSGDAAADDVLERTIEAYARADFAEVERLVEGASEKSRATSLDLSILLSGAKAHSFEYEEAKRILYAIKDAVSSARDELLRAKWNNGLAVVFLYESQFAPAEELLNECLSIAEELDHQALVGNVNRNQGIIHAHMGEVDQAMAKFTRSLNTWRGLGNRRQVALDFYNLSVLQREWGSAVDAAATFLRYEEYVRGEEGPYQEVLARAEKAMILLGLGETAVAVTLAQGLVDRAKAIGSKFLAGIASRSLGCALATTGDHVQAVDSFHQSLHQLASAGNRLLHAEVLEELGLATLQLGDVATGKAHGEAAVSMYRQIGVSRHAERCLSRYEETSISKP